MGLVSQVITVLNPGAFRPQDGVNLLSNGCCLGWSKNPQRQAGNDSANVLTAVEIFFDQFVQLSGIARDDANTRKTIAQNIGQFGRFFYGYEPVVAQAAFENGLRD